MDPAVEIFTRACPLFVPLAEEGWVANDVARRAVASYLSSLEKSGIDTLILGCTHYPFLRPVIEREAGPGITVIDTGEAVARELQLHYRSNHAPDWVASYRERDALEDERVDLGSKRFHQVEDERVPPASGCVVQPDRRIEPHAKGRETDLS